MADIMPPPDPHLTPTDELVLEVLAARYRLGEDLWTFSASCQRAIHRLEAIGYVSQMSGIVEHTIRARLTAEGRTYVICEGYVGPHGRHLASTDHRIVYQDLYQSTCSCGHVLTPYPRSLAEALGLHLERVNANGVA